MQFGSLPGEEVRRSQVKKREGRGRALLFLLAWPHREKEKGRRGGDRRRRGSQALTCSFTSPFFFSFFSGSKGEEGKKEGLVGSFLLEVATLFFFFSFYEGEWMFSRCVWVGEKEERFIKLGGERRRGPPL